ncbi:MAG: T9SS type A sorting domain-containing protein [Bacteroidota bacterium]
MMKIVQLYLIGFLLLSCCKVKAQKHYEIRLKSFPSASSEQLCYNIQLASVDLEAINLAGQNYRLYYDGSKLKFKERHSNLLLPEEKYTPLILKDNIQNIDAYGMGLLGFDHSLSFLNINVDLKDDLNGGIILPASGDWVSTALICFDKINQTNAISDDSNYSIFWAREELTKNYATAFLEITEWAAPNVILPIKAATFGDQEINTSLGNQLWDNLPKVYPNPVKDNFFIEYTGKEALSIQIHSINGQILLEKEYPFATYKYSVNLSHAASGIYQVQLRSKDKVFLQRIEKIQ